MITKAILDRILHFSYLFNITGQSYRIKDKLKPITNWGNLNWQMWDYIYIDIYICVSDFHWDSLVGMFIIKFKSDTCLIGSKAHMLPIILIQEIHFRITILVHRCFFAPFMIFKTNSMSLCDNSCARFLCSKFVRHL